MNVYERRLVDPLDNDCIPALHEGAGDCLAKSWGDAAEHF